MTDTAKSITKLAGMTPSLSQNIQSYALGKLANHSQTSIYTYDAFAGLSCFHFV
jgi:hypothetical protein